MTTESVSRNRAAAGVRRPSGAEAGEAACRGRRGGGSASPTNKETQSLSNSCSGSDGMPFEVLVTANAFRETPGAGRERLLGAGCRITDTPRRGPLPTADLLQALEGKDAVIAATDPYTDLVMAESPRLK